MAIPKLREGWGTAEARTSTTAYQSPIIRVRGKFRKVLHFLSCSAMPLGAGPPTELIGGRVCVLAGELQGTDGFFDPLNKSVYASINTPDVSDGLEVLFDANYVTYGEHVFPIGYLEVGEDVSLIVVQTPIYNLTLGFGAGGPSQTQSALLKLTVIGESLFTAASAPGQTGWR